jgi:hypothetical protein
MFFGSLFSYYFLSAYDPTIWNTTATICHVPSWNVCSPIHAPGMLDTWL